MKRTRMIVFIALVLVQVFIVGSMAANREAVLASGDRVTLATRPVDPRDLFRGDYVVLRYEISTLDLDEVDWATEGPWQGQTVQVVLEEEDGVHEPVGVVGTGEIAGTAIRGQVASIRGDSVQMTYGIETYFVPEGRGWEIERASSLDVVVALDPAGNPVIDYLVVEGARWSE